MRFMLLLKGDERAEAGVLPDTQVVEAMGRFNEEMQEAGVLIAAEGLHPSSKGPVSDSSTTSSASPMGRSPRRRNCWPVSG